MELGLGENNHVCMAHFGGGSLGHQLQCVGLESSMHGLVRALCLPILHPNQSTK